MFAKLATALDGNQHLAWQTQFGNFAVVAEVIGEGDWTIAFSNESIKVSEGSDGKEAIRLRATKDAWIKLFLTTPPIGFSSIYGMFITDNLTLAGDSRAFYCNLLFIEGVFAAGRAKAAPAKPAKFAGNRVEPITGRYLHLEIEGREHRVYFEEAGQGIPLLCLHTAGSDGRQYRGVLNDPEVTKHFRVIAFDLPCHGKSSPPPGFESEIYQLSTDRYMTTVMAIKHALGLEKPVVMGCSIGGRAVLHLALRHGEEFRAAVGLQSALFAELRGTDGDTEMNEFYRPDIFYRPDVNGSEVAAATVACLIAPQAPDADRWETLWHYMQGGPGVFMGDLYYYFVDGDLRNGGLRGLDTAKCPLHLLTGEYDLSATPELTAQLAKEVGATSFEVMKGLGHFPMSENPAQFLSYLRPVLGKIHAAA